MSSQASRGASGLSSRPGGWVAHIDLMGEAANVQQMSPEIVVGHILLFDAKADSIRRQDNLYWSQYFENAVKSMAIRKAPLWNQGLLEGTWFIKFASRHSMGSRVLEPSKAQNDGEMFFSALLRELKVREPVIPFSKHISLTEHVPLAEDHST